MVNRYDRFFPNYPDDSDFTTNAPSYYENLGRKTHLIKLLSKRIWEYENTLNETLEQIEKRLTDYILENDLLMNERLENWDKRIDELDEEVSHIFVEWLNDGTLEQIINHDVLGNKVNQSDLDDTNTQLAQMKTFIKPTMTTLEIQTLINESEVKTFEWEAGNYTVGPLFLKSNATHFFREGCVLQAETGFIENDRLVTIENQENISIYGKMVLKMNKSEYTTGETRHCLAIRENTKNIFIEQLYASDSGGDGVYIGSGSNGRCENIHLQSVFLTNHRRNGLSVTSVNGLKIDRLFIDGVEGTNPQAGIDIEPNWAINPIKNIYFGQVVIKNVFNTGFEVNMMKITDSGVSIDIVVESLTVEKARNGLIFLQSKLDGQSTPNLQGEINIKRVFCKDILYAGIRLMSWYKEKSPDINMGDVTLINCNEIGLTEDSSCYWIGIILPNSTTTAGYTGGGLSIDNVKIIDNREPIKTYNVIFVRNDADSLNAEINIKNINNYKHLSARPMRIEGMANIGKNNTVISKNTSSNVYIDSASGNTGYAGEYNNRGASSQVNFQLKFSLIGSRIKIKVVDPFPITVLAVDTDEVILPDYTGFQKRLFSETVGSYVVIEKVSDTSYVIVEKVGVWSDLLA